MKNTKEYMIAVVGPDTSYQGKKEAQIGDVVSFEKSDGKAVFASNKAGLRIGIISNAENTTPEGCVSVADILEDIDQEFEGIVVDKTSVSFKRSEAQTIALVCKIPQKGHVLKEVEDAKFPKKIVTNTFRILGSGTKRVCPAKYEVTKLVLAGEAPELEFNVTGTVMQFTYNGNVCCIGSADDAYDSPDVAIRALEGATDVKCIAKSNDGISFYVEMTVESECAAKDLIIEDIAKKGILSEEELKKRMEWLQLLKLDERNINAIFDAVADKRQMNESRIPIGDFKFINSDNVCETAIININAGLNLMFEGPKAAGKNTLIEDLAMLYKAPIYEVQINSQTDNETLLGSKTIKSSESAANKDEINACIRALATVMGGDKVINAIASTEDKETAANQLGFFGLINGMDFTPLVNALKGGETEIEFEPSALVKAMEEGGFVVLDEINTGHPEVLSLLNPILDSRRRLDVPGYGLVQAHPRFRVFATMNKDYQGTFELNEATASRFAPVIFEAPKSIQDIIKKNVPEAEEIVLKSCDKIYKQIKKAVEKGERQSDCINLRAFIYACKQIAWGQNMSEAFRRNVADSCSDLEDRAAITEMIRLSLS